MNFEYGTNKDINRLKKLGGGNHLCKLNKMPYGKLCGADEFRICDIDHPLASTITARYYKGISSHKDNMIICRKQ